MATESSEEIGIGYHGRGSDKRFDGSFFMHLRSVTVCREGVIGGEARTKTGYPKGIYELRKGVSL